MKQSTEAYRSKRLVIRLECGCGKVTDPIIVVLGRASAKAPIPCPQCGEQIAVELLAERAVT